MNICKLTTAAVLLAALPVLADRIELKDGRIVNGTVSRQGDKMFIRGDDGVNLTVAADDVVRVTLTGSITPAQAAEAEWTKVNAQVRRSDDFKTALDLLELYVAKHGAQAAAATAKTQIEEMRKIANESPVKYRGRFVPAKQAEALQKLSEEKVRPAIEAYRAGKVKEAFDLAKEVLKTDEENTLALTVAGLAAYRQNFMLPARTHFHKLAEIEPDNVLAQNNLAVVNAQQKNDGAACLAYTRAMGAMPDNRLVVDNVTEYLNANPGLKSTTAGKDMIRQYEQADARVQAIMAKKDLYRFGGVWLKKADAEKIASQRQQITQAMAQLDAQFKSTQTAITTTEAQIKQATIDYNNTVNDILYLNSVITVNISKGVDVSPLLVRRDALNIDADRIARARAAMEAKLKELQEAIKPMYAEAEKLKAALASVANVQYTGVQRILDLGEEKSPPPPTPVVMPGLVSATAPATGATKTSPLVLADDTAK